MNWPIDYLTLVQHLLELEQKWLQGEQAQKYDDFEYGKDEGRFKCALELRKILKETGMYPEDPEDSEQEELDE